jgi:hypothetical protein
VIAWLKATISLQPLWSALCDSPSIPSNFIYALLWVGGAGISVSGSGSAAGGAGSGSEVVSGDGAGGTGSCPGVVSSGGDTGGINAGWDASGGEVDIAGVVEISGDAEGVVASGDGAGSSWHPAPDIINSSINRVNRLITANFFISQTSIFLKISFRIFSYRLFLVAGRAIGAGLRFPKYPGALQLL